jgi:GMP synthase (glutamine-hydrolysing)
VRVLVLQNSPLAPASHLGSWLQQRGATLRIQLGPDLPCGPWPGADLLLTLGSPKAAYDNDQWITRQRDLLAGWIMADRPVIGICFGA